MGISLLCLEEMNMCDENMNLVMYLQELRIVSLWNSIKEIG